MNLSVFVPKRIEELRIKKRMTSYALGKKAGVDQSVLTNIQKKGRMPTLETLNKICNGLGVTISHFFSGEYSTQLTDNQIQLLNDMDYISEEERKLVETYLHAFVDANRMKENQQTKER